MYVDNELSASEKNAVEEFVQQNSDLEEELNMLKQSVIKPESNIVFENKNVLLKQTGENSFINLNNYEEYFLMYIDDELNTSIKKQVEEFVSKNPSLQNEFHLLQQTKLEVDDSIVFEGKETLYKEEKRRVVPFAWITSAAAVAVLLIALFLFFNKNNGSVIPPEKTVAFNDSNKNENKGEATIKDNNKKTLAVTSDSSDALNNSKLAEVKTINRDKEEKKSSNEIASVQNKFKKEDRKKENDVKIVESNDEIDKANIASLAKIDNTIITSRKEKSTAANSDIAPEKLVVIVDKPVDLSDNKNTKSSYAILTSTTDETTNDDPEKKNKLRGIFRRVSRAFNKSSNDDDNGKRSVAIGSFQIALK
jgi:hypothetical protein